MKKLVVSALSLALMAGVVSPFTNATKVSASELTSPPVLESGVPGENKIEVVYDKNEVSIAPPTLPINEGAPYLQSVSTKSVYGSTWNYNKTVKYSQKATWTTVAAAASAIGLYSGIKYLTLGGIVGNWIIANKGSWLYYSDKQYWRMAGSTLQTKHVVTWYKDKARTKKIQTQEYITNDRG